MKKTIFCKLGFHMWPNTWMIKDWTLIQWCKNCRESRKNYVIALTREDYFKRTK